MCTVPSVLSSGVFCSRMFDRYACWSDGQPNSTVKVPCPWYLPWYSQGMTQVLLTFSVNYCVHDQRCALQPLLRVRAVRNNFVVRECGPDGQWATSNSSRTWRDHSQCQDNSQWEAQVHTHTSNGVVCCGNSEQGAARTYFLLNGTI